MRLEVLCILVIAAVTTFHGGCTPERWLDNDSPRDGNQECPTWFIHKNTSSGCKCGSPIGGSIGILVLCNQDTNETMLLAGFCMTYVASQNITLVGGCPYNYHKVDAKGFYVRLPEDVSILTSFMCEGLNRTDLLCGHCEEGLGTAVLSYKRNCMKCLDRRYGWIVYVAAALLPLTLFYLIVILLSIHATAAHMNAFIFASQMIACMVNANPYTLTAIPPPFNTIVVILYTFYGFWNLDFFRYVIPPFCLSNSLSDLHVVAMEYIVAFYSLFLILLTYICIKLHDRGCKILVFLGLPFRKLNILKRWNPKNFIVGIFATFLLLSYSKLLFVSYNLLASSTLYNSFGKSYGPPMVYYDASTPYFGTVHLPFAILAISVLCVFVVSPLVILLLYPTRAFQRVLNVVCGTRSRNAMQAFADTYQGCYKDGTNGTWDCRYFAGLYFLFRIILLTAAVMSNYYIWLVLILCPTAAAFLFAIVRPYKDNRFNMFDSFSFAMIALAAFGIKCKIIITCWNWIPISTMLHHRQ